MIFRCTVLLLLAFPLLASAQEAKEKVLNDNNPAANSELSVQNEAKLETDNLTLLRAQLSEARSFQSQILSTVYWSLGTLAGVAVILVTYGWWTNFRVYERDKETLERELRSVVSESVREVSDERWSMLDEKLADFKANIGELLEAIEEKSELSINSAVEKSNKSLNSKITRLGNDLASLESEVISLHLAAQIQERQEEISRGIYRNALQSSVSALELANKTGDEYEVGEVLDLISEDISRLLGSDDLPIDNFLVGQLTARLDEVKGRHAHSAASLKAKAPQLLLSKV